MDAFGAMFLWQMRGDGLFGQQVNEGARDVWLMLARGVNPYSVPLILHACDQVALILL